MTDLYDIAREVTDEVMGEGTYEKLNDGNPDPKVQEAIKRAPKSSIDRRVDAIKQDWLDVEERIADESD